MKNTRISLLVGALCMMLASLPAISGAQETWRAVDSIDCKATFITSDHLGNIYTLEGSTLSCRDTSGKMQYTYSNLNSGLFTSIDASDPLKLLLFCREFATLRILDQKLSLQGSEIDLQGMTGGNIILACTSYESGFWVFDASDVQLLRFSSSAELKQSSGNINMVTGEEVQPHFLMEQNNMVYLCDSDRGIFVFDRYGTYLKNLPFFHVLSMQSVGDILFLMTPEKIIAYNNTDHTISEISPPESFISGCIRHGFLYLLNGTQMKIYSLE